MVLIFIALSFSCRTCLGDLLSLECVSYLIAMQDRLRNQCPLKHSKTSFEKNCFSAWASTLNMGLINKVDMVCFSPMGYGV